MYRTVFLSAALLFAGAASAIAQSDAPLEAGESETYLLKRGDVVEISVLEDSSLNRSVLVRPDGKISLPLAGTIDAQDITPEQLQSIIRQRLAKDFVEPPTVTVSLVSSTDQIEETELDFVYVLGQVGQPGRIELTEPVDILQALAIAGGPSIFAATERIQIRKRDENGGETVTLFNYETVLDGAGVQLLMVEDGDVIVVPERGLFE